MQIYYCKECIYELKCMQFIFYKCKSVIFWRHIFYWLILLPVLLMISSNTGHGTLREMTLWLSLEILHFATQRVQIWQFLSLVFLISRRFQAGFCGSDTDGPRWRWAAKSSICNCASPRFQRIHCFSRLVTSEIRWPSIRLSSLLFFR